MSSQLGVNLYSSIYAPIRVFEVKIEGEKPFTVEASRIMYNTRTGTQSLEKGLGVTVFSASESDILYIRAVD